MKKYYNKDKNDRIKKESGGIHMKNKRVINNMSGITLIVLIVTIVVLLILAGVTIASFTGDHGLLNETKDMKNNIEGLQNQTIDDLQQMANDLSQSAGDALNP